MEGTRGNLVLKGKGDARVRGKKRGRRKKMIFRYILDEVIRGMLFGDEIGFFFFLVLNQEEKRFIKQKISTSYAILLKVENG